MFPSCVTKSFVQAAASRVVVSFPSPSRKCNDGAFRCLSTAFTQDDARQQNSSGLNYELFRYGRGMPIQSSFTPPSTWYTKKQFFERDREAVFLRKNWVAVDVWTDQRPGAFKSGTFLGEPYLLTRNKDGQLRAFYNVCSHAGSCLAGPWTTAQQSTDSSSCLRLSADLVGQSSEGCLSAGGSFQCPYHGWRFNLDGRLTKATQTKGIQNFRAKDYSLKSIPARQLGPIVFLNFGGSEGEEEQGSFDESQSRFSERLYQNGFVPDLSDLQLVESRRYTLQVCTLADESSLAPSTACG